MTNNFQFTMTKPVLRHLLRNKLNIEYFVCDILTIYIYGFA